MSGEKTEQATPKKIEDARKKGQVGQSQDVPKLLITAGVLEAVLSMVETGMNKLESMVSSPLTVLDQPFGYAVKAVATNCFLIMCSMLAIALGIAVIMRLAGTWMQFGFLFAPEALQFDLNKINPLNQIKQMFSGKKLFELFTNICKAAIIGSLLWFILPPAFDTLLMLPLTDLDSAWQGIAAIFVRLERVCLMLLLVLAAIDFGMQKYFHLKSLKMSKDDVKQEYKNAEGDPHMKGHRKSLARELASSDGPAKGPELGEADALVVNPTHYAVALYYRPELTPLPVVVTKGVDDDALDLISQAQEREIPVIRFVWLARTLHKVDEGEFIPRPTLRYVARIYQVIRELDNEAGRSNDVMQIEDIENI
ncbi:type III secretion system export apparatus subunit SctU [Pokkaliibacter sp. CJK22405]|uniref:type III secretion system export apparatus subunit SctU n=1 Tax=Pokkaliibacter sp. CJK22405 TaxID=3384615 RepID=UPI003984899D